MQRWIVFALLAVVLASCGEPTPPTIGPIETDGGQPDSGVLTLSTTTNCAMAGETITFTLQVLNKADYPLRFTNPPLFDMTISKVNGPQIRWSDTDQYPTDINAVMAPREVREYQWQWVPTLEGLLSLEVRTAALLPPAKTPNEGSAILYFGVNYMSWDRGGAGGPIDCAELKR